MARPGSARWCKPKVDDHGIESAVWKTQLLRVTFLKVDTWIMLLCECDHRAGKVVEPALTALLADLPEAKAAVEQRSTAFQPIIAAAKAGDAPHAADCFSIW